MYETVHGDKMAVDKAVLAGIFFTTCAKCRIIFDLVLIENTIKSTSEDKGLPNNLHRASVQIGVS